MPPLLAHAPMAMHHFGSGIWSQMRFTASAILYVTVPATIITSLWRGEKRNTSTPKRERSYREQAAAIISIAQQASHMDMGQSEFLRIQLLAASSLVMTTLPSILES